MTKKLFFIFFAFLLFIFSSSYVFAAYVDYSITDIVLPNTVRAGQDLNVTFIISSGTTGGLTVDVNLYNPQGTLVYSGSKNMIVGTNNFTIPVAANLVTSTQSYMIRGLVTSNDDYPENNTRSKFFAVAKSTDKVPVSDIPLFSGVFVALLFLFILSYTKSSKNKK